MKKIFILILFTFVIMDAGSQTKKILGDIAAYNSYHNADNYKTLKRIDSEDFKTSTREFNFRFQRYGQVIKIWGNLDSIGGLLTNYVFRMKDKNIIIERIELDKKLAHKVYNLILSSEILNIDTDKNIEEWERGMDGTTYTIEHTKNNNYWYKSYWTPSAQDSLKEALVVIDFVDK